MYLLVMIVGKKCEYKPWIWSTCSGFHLDVRLAYDLFWGIAVHLHQGRVVDCMSEHSVVFYKHE